MSAGQWEPLPVRNAKGRLVKLSGRQQAVRDLILDWAEQFAPEAPTRAIDDLAKQASELLPTVAALRVRGGMWKPGATPDDARRLAARLELESTRPVGGCVHCGGRCAAGQAECAWCARRLARSRAAAARRGDAA